jgi:catechol 2,3-dioxygenase-like lactoylglutathione lyase family enzyme
MLHHVDVHVRELDSAGRFFEAFAAIVGYRRLPDDEPGFIGYETSQGGRPRIGLILDDEHRAGSMRLAFSVQTRGEVDEAARALRLAGAQAVEGPGVHAEYGEYYAVFCEDPDGNKYEIVAP